MYLTATAVRFHGTSDSICWCLVAYLIEVTTFNFLVYKSCMRMDSAVASKYRDT